MPILDIYAKTQYVIQYKIDGLPYTDDPDFPPFKFEHEAVKAFNFRLNQKEKGGFSDQMFRLIKREIVTKEIGITV